MFTREQFLKEADATVAWHTDHAEMFKQAAAQAKVIEDMRAWLASGREEYLKHYAKVSEQAGMNMSAAYADGSQTQFGRVLNELTRLEREAGLR